MLTLIFIFFINSFLISATEETPKLDPVVQEVLQRIQPTLMEKPQERFYLYYVMNDTFGQMDAWKVVSDAKHILENQNLMNTALGAPLSQNMPSFYFGQLIQPANSEETSSIETLSVSARAKLMTPDATSSAFVIMSEKGRELLKENANSQSYTSYVLFRGRSQSCLYHFAKH